MRGASRPMTLLAGTLVGLLLASLAMTPPVVGQDAKDDKKPTESKVEKVTWDRVTDDGVKIVGDFYPGSKPGRNAPVVILAHAVGRATAKRQDFEKFPEKLAEKGYAVITFDWRGYGESTEVMPDSYWSPAIARPRPSGFKMNDPPTKISARDWRRWTDLLWLPNDLICVKKWIATKNNAMECNSSNICIIGAEDGALMSFLWLTQEFTNSDRWKTPGTATTPPKTEGEDVTACIWLSMPNTIAAPGGTKKNVERTIREWMEYPHRRASDRASPQYSMFYYYPVIKTFSIYGQNDTDVASFWNRAIKWIKPRPDDKSMEHTGAKVIKNTNLAGTKLLGNESFGTDHLILDYLDLYMPKGRPWQQQIDPDRLEPKLFRVNGLNIQ